MCIADFKRVRARLRALRYIETSEMLDTLWRASASVCACIAWLVQHDLCSACKTGMHRRNICEVLDMSERSDGDAATCHRLPVFNSAYVIHTRHSGSAYVIFTSFRTDHANRPSSHIPVPWFPTPPDSSGVQFCPCGI